MPLSHGSVWAGSVCSQQLFKLVLGAGTRVRPRSAAPLMAGVKFRHTLLKAHAVPGATTPSKLELPVGSTAMIAMILPGFACGIIQLRGPDIEWVMITAGPIRSSKWVTAAVVSDKARLPSGMLATWEEKNWSNAYSPGNAAAGATGPLRMQ